MKTINFNFPFLDLDGTPNAEVNTGKIVAEILATGSSAKPQKSIELARAILKKGTIDVMSEDEQLIRNALMASNKNDLFKSQVLDRLDGAKPLHDEKPASVPQPEQEEEAQPAEEVTP